MMSMKDMFYGESEPVWILKPEKKDDNKKGEKKDDNNKQAEKSDYSILSTIPFYPYYSPDYVAPPTQKKEEKDKETKVKKEEKDKETKVVLKVPMCCGECEDMVNIALYALKGVKSVDCNSRKERVTVVSTTAAAADILKECRRLFKKSRMWSDDD